MEKTITIIVTYNRQQLLSECINALRNQTHPCDKILVVNNGSTDDTENWLSLQKDVEYISQGNTGSAGGFYTGIKWAYDHGYTWVWCMDDDGYPKEDALEKLLRAHNPNDLCLLNCAVVDKENKHKLVWKTQQFTDLDEVDQEIIFGKGHPFNGTLIHRKIIEAAGFPDKKLFLWGEETEYYYRITRKNKFKVATVTSSIHYHPAAVFSIRKDWDYKASWKMYYYVRNRLAIHRSKFDNKGYALLNYVAFIIAFFAANLIFQKTNKFKKALFIVWPLIDSLKSNYAETPFTITQRLKAQSVHPYFKDIQGGWQYLFSPAKKHREAISNGLSAAS
ncbi:MAG: glycosyltransferase family 2 protein [Bacteroidetes bacterium]|nr:glycosyltransferase family 2 protein [Bacteroidota bacterium]